MNKGGDTRRKAAANGKKVGRPPKQPKLTSEQAKTLAGEGATHKAGELIHALHHFSPKESLEVAGWRRFWDSLNQDIALNARKYLYDKRDGQAVRTINHLHDKPIDMNVTISIAEIVRKVRERKEQYERSR